MSQVLNINGKTYQQSALLAERFGYTSDYVSRLAREGKIEASQVGRQWFIDAGSLERFVQMGDVKKETRGEELRTQRKVERLQYAGEVKQSTSKNSISKTAPATLALAQSMAVVTCGLFAGLLGWTVSGNDMGLSDFSQGANSISTQVFEHMSFDTTSVHQYFKEQRTQTEDAFVYARTHAMNGFTELPLEQTAVVVRSGSGTSTPVSLFSDEVEIFFESDEKGIVRPVFKSGRLGAEYQMLLVPSEDNAHTE